MPIRVIIIDDSVIFRTKIQNILNQEPDLEVVGTAGNPIDAIPLIEQLKPDILSMDIEMPRMSGLEFLKLLHSQKPYPTVLVSSLPLKQPDATKYGAVDFVAKPDLTKKDTMESFTDNLKKAIRKGVNTPIPKIQVPTNVSSEKTDTSLKLNYSYNREIVIAIGASTGGTEAIIEVVKNLPKNTPGIVIVQHLPANFTAMYTSRLKAACQMDVKTAENLDRIKQGQIILANGDHHLIVRRDKDGLYINSKKGERFSGHCPSVDIMFDSVAEVCPKHAIGVILTGMGADGAVYMKKMRDKGAYTIGQDAKTSVVYGMPMEAFKRGAVMKQLPLTKIPEEIIRHLSTKYK